MKYYRQNYASVRIDGTYSGNRGELIENSFCNSFFMRRVSVYGSYPIMSQQLNTWLLQEAFLDLLMLLRVLQKRRYCWLLEVTIHLFFSFFFFFSLTNKCSQALVPRNIICQSHVIAVSWINMRYVPLANKYAYNFF